MLVVGLTGGIGSGKSSVATLFAECGAPIIDTDIIARELVAPKQPAFDSIIHHFGQDLVMPDGTLNRTQLREIIFTDTKERLWLENLLHPLIKKEMEHQINQLQAPYCIVIIPLLFEVEFYSMINRILVIDAPEALQIERVMTRDNVPKTKVQSILKTQTTRRIRLSRAHDVITNDGHKKDLLPQVKRLHELYTQIGQS